MRLSPLYKPMTHKPNFIDLTREEILNGSTIEDLLSEGEMHMDDLPICEPDYEEAERRKREGWDPNFAEKGFVLMHGPFEEEEGDPVF